MHTLPRNIACGAAGAALSIGMTHLGYACVYHILQRTYSIQVPIDSPIYRHDPSGVRMCSSSSYDKHVSSSTYDMHTRTVMTHLGYA